MLLDNSELVVYCVSKIDLTIRTVVASRNIEGLDNLEVNYWWFLNIVYIKIVVQFVAK